MNKGSIVERLCSDLDRKEPRYKSPTLLYTRLSLTPAFSVAPDQVSWSHAVLKFEHLDAQSESDRSLCCTIVYYITPFLRDTYENHCSDIVLIARRASVHVAYTRPRAVHVLTTAIAVCGAACI